MSGLYQRALYILNQDHESTTQTSGDITFDTDSGISLDEQKQILKQIENVVAENRITVNDEVLKLKPEKRGILFPILINSIGVVLTVGVFFLFQWFFSRQVQQIQLDTQLYSGGDSKLISNIKKEAEERLSEKEREINTIQEQLENLDNEKLKLQENMNSEIEKRNRELELEMQRVLDAERKRLNEQGISTEDIDAQIEEIKKQKELENKQELESFQKEVEAERIKQEKQLEELENSYMQNLEGLNSEKASLAKDLEQKEKELREFEAEQKNLVREKTEAETKLKEMDEQRKKQDQLNVQIRGMYENINAQMKAGNYNVALKSLEEMRGFFYDKATATLPSILARREVELFIIESLENLIRGELAKADIDTASLIEKANLITSISAKANEAEQLYKQKDFAGAQKRYEEALAIIPAIEQSYTNLTAMEVTRKNQLFADYYTQAETSYNDSKYADALEYYKKAIKLFPNDAAKVDTMITRIMEAGYKLAGDEAAIVEDEKNANQLLSKASQALRNEDYKLAIDYYVEILTKYSRTTQVNSARNGINTAITREREAFIKEMNAAIAEKDKTIAEKDALISEMDKTDIIASITGKANEATNLFNKNDFTGAKRLYKETLSIIPEVEKSHNNIVFIDDAAKNDRFISYFSAAETSYAAENYKDAIDKYTEAIKLFPKDQTVVNTIILQIMESGYKLKGDPSILDEEEKAANELIIKASGELRKQNYQGALDAYFDILARYPRTSKAISAQNGIKTTITREKEALAKQQEARFAEQDALIKEQTASLAAKETEISRLKKIEQDFTQKITLLEKDKAEMEAELVSLREKVAKNNESAGTTTEPDLLRTPDPTPAPTEGSTLSPGETGIPLSEDEVIISKEEMDEFNRLKKQISELKDQYTLYTKQEDEILAKQGTLGYLKTKNLLGDILNSAFTKEIFPDLYERIKRFDDALVSDAQKDGQYIAVDNILSIIYNRLVLDTNDDPAQYWNTLRKDYSEDTLFLDLLDELEDLMEK
ncbi:MAG: hypothetical protein JXJ04_03590 [Spirochaetales bacterium]|nr:hypothetical protein [Spirochaetales bacterium]